MLPQTLAVSNLSEYLVGHCPGSRGNKQNESEWSLHSGRACSGSTPQQGGVVAELGHWGPQSTVPVCGLIICVFCLLQLLIHWANQEPCSSASPPWFGSRKGKAWCNYVRRVVRFCFYPWCFPGQWGNSLINSVAGLGDPRPLSHSCYSLSHSCYSKVKRYEAFQGISLMNLQK